MVQKEAKKPGVRGNHCSYRPQIRTNYKSDVSGLENFVFGYELTKHAVKYVDMEKAIANYMQKEYTKGGPDIAEAIRTGKLPMVIIPTKPIGGDENGKQMWFHSYKRSTDKKIIL